MLGLSYRAYSVVKAIPLIGIMIEMYFLFFIYCVSTSCSRCTYIYNKTDVFLKNFSRQYFNIPNGPFNKLMTGADVIKDSSNHRVRKRVYKLVGSYVVLSIWHALAVAWNLLLITETNTCDQNYDCFTAHNRSFIEAVDCNLVDDDVPVYCVRLNFFVNQALASAGGIITIFTLILSAMGYLCKAVSSMCGGKCVQYLRYSVLILLWMIYWPLPIYYATRGIVLVQLLLESVAYVAALTNTLLIPWEKILEEDKDLDSMSNTFSDDVEKEKDSETPEIVVTLV